MSKLVKDNLNDLEFSEFLESGFIVQNPADSMVFLGILTENLNSDINEKLIYTLL